MLGGRRPDPPVDRRPACTPWPGRCSPPPDGTKLGKTTGARIWLDADRTSPYQLFQYWMATDDRQVRQFLAQFTLLPVAEIDAVVAAHEAAPERREAQRRLAREATALVHGAGAARGRGGGRRVRCSAARSTP